VTASFVVLVEVMVDALDPVDSRHGIGAGGSNAVIPIDSNHNLFFLCGVIRLVKTLERKGPSI
jgi:hypothetical protein